MLFQVILPIPFSLFFFRTGLGIFSHGGDERTYTDSAKEMTIMMICGLCLLPAAFSRMVSATPYFELENDAIVGFIFTYILGALLEFRNRLVDATIPIIILSHLYYTVNHSPNVAMIIYWMTVFSMLRGMETILGSLAIFEEYRPWIERYHKYVSDIELATIYFKLWADCMALDKMDLVVYFALIILPFVYFGALSESRYIACF